MNGHFRMVSARTGPMQECSCRPFVAFGRFFGDSLKIKLGTIKVAVIFVNISVLGLILLVIADELWLAFAGFALIGLGVSVGFPLAVSATSSIDDKKEASYIAFLSLTA